MMNFIVIALFLLLPALASAQIFNVSTTAQFRTALENASVNGADDTIILEAGTYKTTDDGLGTFKFSDTEAHNLTIKAQTGLTANDVILDGVNTHQALNLTNTQTATFTIDRVMIRNGKSSFYSNGGGIYASDTLIVTNSTISGNTASGGGGGIYASDTLIVTNSTISGNTASGGGGGIYGSTVTVTNSTISGNTASSSSGGGGISGSTVTVTNSTISGNTASGNYAGGGGLYGSTVTVTNSIISGNTASGNYGGGGISGSTVTVTNSTISGNTASGSYGCGIKGYGTFVNNIFDNNSSDIYFTGASDVYNNYIDYTKLQNESSYTIVKQNNIQPSSGSLNFADSSFRLGPGSVAIDKGLDPSSTTFTGLITDAATLQTVQNALQTDKGGNTRIIGSAIDLGAYEYATSTLTLSTTSLTFTSTSGTASITVTGSGAWTATSTLSWATITSGSSGTGNGTVTISVYANTTGATRTGNITIANQTVTITQNANQPVLLVTTTQTSYDTIQAAYNANTAASGSSILVQATTLTEALVFNQNNNITLTGGYDSSFSTVGGTMTTVQGLLTISGGTVTVSNIVIQ